MSKIQDALGKIQRTRRREASTQGFEDSVVIANLVDRAAKHDSFSSGDKCLHVDGDALRGAGLIAPDYDEQLMADQYRDIKRPLIAHAFGKRATKIENGNLIMVSSALAGEGKTFTSINLALSMARERDYSVLLVDADVAKPHISRMFGAETEPGLLDVLEDPDLPVRTMLLPTDVQNLSVLPAGKPRRHSTELLASAAMEDVCDTLAELSSGQLIVFDSPPLLQTSEAKVLASLAGQIVLVVCAEETSQEAVTGALGSMDEGKAVSLVLNQVRKGFGEYQYGYGKGYGYGRKERKKYPSQEKSTGFFD